jgi:hypothetical protein
MQPILLRRKEIEAATLVARISRLMEPVVLLSNV